MVLSILPSFFNLVRILVNIFLIKQLCKFFILIYLCIFRYQSFLFLFLEHFLNNFIQSYCYLVSQIHLSMLTSVYNFVSPMKSFPHLFLLYHACFLLQFIFIQLLLNSALALHERFLYGLLFVNTRSLYSLATFHILYMLLIRRIVLQTVLFY